VVTHAAVASRSKTAILVALEVAVIGFSIQQTSVVPAVQSIEMALHSSPEWSAWLVTVYLMVATVATPAMGRLGDLHGRRRMLIVGLGVFVVGSVAAALAPNMAVLIVCRALQGVGGAVYPLCLAVARDLVDDTEMTKTVGLLTGGFGLGTAIGFAGGGLLAEDASWRWIFAGGAVVVAAGFMLVVFIVPEVDERADGRFDLRGTAVLSVAVIAVLAAFTFVVPLGWLSPVTVGLFVIALGSFGFWTRAEMHRADPLVDLHVLREPTVVRANLAATGLGWALFGTYLLVPQFAATDPATSGFGFGAGPVAVGLVLLPLALGQTIAGPLAGSVSERVPARVSLCVGLAAVSAALAIFCAVGRSALLGGAAMLLLGLGAGAALEASSAVATEGVANDVAAVSSALNSTLRRLAGGLGGQISTIILASLVVTSSGAPSRSAYVLAFAIAAVLPLAGLAAVAVRAPHA
jgi:MFS family permease